MDGSPTQNGEILKADTVGSGACDSGNEGLGVAERAASEEYVNSGTSTNNTIKEEAICTESENEYAVSPAHSETDMIVYEDGKSAGPYPAEDKDYHTDHQIFEFADDDDDEGDEEEEEDDDDDEVDRELANTQRSRSNTDESIVSDQKQTIDSKLNQASIFANNPNSSSASPVEALPTQNTAYSENEKDVSLPILKILTGSVSGLEQNNTSSQRSQFTPTNSHTSQNHDSATTTADITTSAEAGKTASYNRETTKHVSEFHRGLSSSPLKQGSWTDSPISKLNVGRTPQAYTKSNPYNANEKFEDKDYTISDNYKMQFPSNINAVQRSSIYESRSTVTAMPIRTPSYKRGGNNNMSNSMYGSKIGHTRGKSKDNDDTASLHSLSSSLTASFSKNFLFGFYKNKSSRKKRQQIALLPRQYWMKDENCRECFSCGKSFNTFRRKHHCRVCGQIFCNNCTLLIEAEKLGYDGKIRICQACFEHCDNDYYEDSSDDDLSVMNETINRDDDTMDTSDHLLLHSTMSEQRNHNDVFTVGFNEHNYENSIRLNNATDVVSVFGEDDLKVLTESLNAPKMTIPTTRTGEALEIRLPPHSSSQYFKPELHKSGSLHHSSQAGKINTEFSRVKSILRGHPKEQGKDNESILSPYPEHKHMGGAKSHNTIFHSNIFPENNSYTKELTSSNSVAHNLASGNFKFEFRMNNQHTPVPRNKIPVSWSQSKLSTVSQLSSYNDSDRTETRSNNNAKNTRESAIYEGFPTSLPGSSITINELSPSLTTTNGASGASQFDILNSNQRLVSPGPAWQKDNRVSFIEDDSDLNSGEDERSMSIFAALNDSHMSYPLRKSHQEITEPEFHQLQRESKDQLNADQALGNAEDLINFETPKTYQQPTRLAPRNDLRSNQRAEASLQRIRTRRQSRSKSFLLSNKNNSIFSHSTPNLLSILSSDPERAGTKDARHKNKHDSVSKRIISTNNGFTENKTSLNETLQLHAKALMKQVLTDQMNLDVLKWTEFFQPVLRNIESIDVSTKITNSMDFRQYVKIKRIAGGEMGQSEFINGIVFSKNNPLKQMARNLSSPKILLLMFPLSYQKNDNHLLSLELVLAQEKEYLNSLVSRITALNPNLIFVNDNVSGYALNLLHKAGIVVQFNVKPQVIEKISRFTEADIANSVDKLVANMRLGRCQTFEVKTYLYGDIAKTYTFLRGCSANLGGTILLRGLDMEALRNLKDTAEFMVFVILSMKLESSLLKDNFVELFLAEYNKMCTERLNRKSSGYFSEFVEKFHQRILSISPSVDFPLPFLLERTRLIEESIEDVQSEKAKVASFDDHSLQLYIESDALLKEVSSMERVSLKDMRYLAEFILDKKIADLTEGYFLKRKQWEIFFSLSYNMLGTGTHQSISVLYSMVSNKTGTPCIGPQVITVEYFWNNDVTIGQFIENIVSTLHFPCSAECGGTFMDHYRSYVHGHAKIDVVVEKLQSKLPALKNIILMWTYCKKCKMSSPILQMSDSTWNYSFGKYLELMFWSVPTCMGGLGNCCHDILRDHVKYFSFNDIVVRLEYSSVDIHQLITPRTQVVWKPLFNIKSKIELVNSIHSKIDSFYSSVLKRLVRVKLDSHGNTTEGLKLVQLLKEKSNSERDSLHELTVYVYMSTPGDEFLELNSVTQKLHSSSIEWIRSFAEFEKKYLPSEKDIARITASQLKKMFADPDIKEEPKESSEAISQDSSNTGSNDTAENAVQQSEVSEKNEDTSISSTHDSVGEAPVDAAPAETGAADTLSRNSETFDEMSLTNRPAHELSSHLRKINTDGSSGQESAVGKLTVFFDQMHFDALSREFEHQREVERLQLNKRYRNPLLRAESSVPIVDIYKNVNDAVNEPLHMEPQLEKGSDEQSGYFTHRHLSDNKTDRTSVDHFREKSNTDSGGILTPNLKSTEHSKDTLPLPPVTTTATTTADQNYLPLSEEPQPVEGGHEAKQAELPETTEEQELGQSEQQEKTSLLKVLSNFWADRSATLWEPLQSPLGPNEHVFADNNVLIREDEPTSLVAFCLNTPDYILKMTQSYSSATTSNVDNVVDNFEDTEILESLLNKKTAMHLRYQLQDGNVVMSCKIFFAEQFDAFRRACGCKNNFIQSLSRCLKWDSSGGKSGSAFLKTLDDRFVIKELSHVELDTFIKFAPNYFHYMGQAMFHDLPTALAKILGFYQIHIKNTETGKVFKRDVIITENLFYGRKNLRIFDLKGSMRNRHVEQTGRANEVLLDENMVEYIYESPVFVREYDKKLLRASLWNDTLFLSKMNVMDYSLVIGIDSVNQKLTVGIIDCIRTFTWDKKLESWVKEKGFVGSSTKEPTVVTPKQYKNRFREAMERYILVVPDPWFKENMVNAV